MGPVSFLIIAVVVGVIGILVAVNMNRTPRHPDFAMEEFRREMQALAPPRAVEAQRVSSPDTEHQPGSRGVPGTPQIKRVGPVAAPEED